MTQTYGTHGIEWLKRNFIYFLKEPVFSFKTALHATGFFLAAS